jgi:hypothetical protein
MVSLRCDCDVPCVVCVRVSAAPESPQRKRALQDATAADVAHHGPSPHSRGERALDFGAQAANRATFTQAADLLLRDAKGFEHNAFKIDLARRAIVRALTQAARGTPQSQSSKKVL